MSTGQASRAKKIKEKRGCAETSEEVACPGCSARMSRRCLKKPDDETGLVEVIYRCPQCGTVTARWVNE
jgi:uncharacterized Zn finger protein